MSNRDFEALVAGLWTPGQEELCAPYVARYLARRPRIAERGQAFAAGGRLRRAADADAAGPAPGAARRPRGRRPSGPTTPSCAAAGGTTVDDYDVALRVRRAG